MKLNIPNLKNLFSNAQERAKAEAARDEQKREQKNQAVQTEMQIVGTAGSLAKNLEEGRNLLEALEARLANYEITDETFELCAKHLWGNGGVGPAQLRKIADELTYGHIISLYKDKLIDGCRRRYVTAAEERLTGYIAEHLDVLKRNGFDERGQ